MAETLSLAVWCAEPTARFDTRKFHFVRRDALHDALDTCDTITVLDWGKTDDKYNNEIIDLVVEADNAATSSAGASPADIPVLAYLGLELAKSAASRACVEAVMALIAQLAPKQVAGEIAVVQMHLLNNCVVILYPAGQVAQTTILRLFSPDGSQIDVPYNASDAEIAQLTGKHA